MNDAFHSGAQRLEPFFPSKAGSMSSKTETKHHVIERGEDPQHGRTLIDLATGGFGFFLPHGTPDKVTTIRDKETGITVTRSGKTQDEADRLAYDELQSEKASRR
jgi:hypothetical protein